MALGVSPAGMNNGHGIDSKSVAGETPALPEKALCYLVKRKQGIVPSFRFSKK
jgi:hypothetical protein